MAPDEAAQGAPSLGHTEAGQYARQSTTESLLTERSRRRTVTSVLDHLTVHGGKFAESRADGSAWSATIPPHPEAPR